MNRFFVATSILLASINMMLCSVEAYAQDEPITTSTLAQTPQMGWNSWNCFHCDIDEDLVKTMADAMVATGLRDAGYIYLNLDDCWHGERDADGFIQCDPVRFPSGMEALTEYVHSLGLKIGIYSCAGTNTCAGKPGSLGHEYQDALQYARWGFDYLKYDWCFTENINPKGAYKLMSEALKASGREIFFSMCEWGSSQPWEWAAEIGHSWRTTGDIGPTFDGIAEKEWENSIMKITDLNEPLRKYAGPGHWNDPDMLEVDNGISVPESRAHFTLWALMNAPLILGNDVRTMSQEIKDIVLNKDVIALNQDPLGVQGLRFTTELDGALEVWMKPLAGGDWAICFFNRSLEDINGYHVDWASYEFVDEEVSGEVFSVSDKRYQVYNIWEGQTEGDTALRMAKVINIPSHDVVLYRLSPVKPCNCCHAK